MLEELFWKHQNFTKKTRDVTSNKNDKGYFLVFSLTTAGGSFFASNFVALNIFFPVGSYLATRLYKYVGTNLRYQIPT